MDEIQKATGASFREPTQAEHEAALDAFANRVDVIATQLEDRIAVLDKVSAVKATYFVLSQVAQILSDEAIQIQGERRKDGYRLVVSLPTALQIAASRFEPDIAFAVEGQEGCL